MKGKCDICGEREATHFDRVLGNSVIGGKFCVEYAYCEACYTGALKSGRSPQALAEERIARRGKECRACGSSIEQFEKSLLLGCPDCYRNMRDAILDFVRKSQYGRSFDYCLDGEDNIIRMCSCASDDDIKKIVKDTVVSSRVRLARNVEGLNFPHLMLSADSRTVDIIKGATRAAEGVFKANLLTMSSLTKPEKKALLERHVISLPLANNELHGAVLLEKGKASQISVMINEEDHIREQCTVYGHNLERAYARLHAYDMRLQQELNIARDLQFGFLTACPTNVGTGMRASEMLFLPALERSGFADELFARFKDMFDITVRGYFGEGSGAAYGMYQVSNGRTFGESEHDTIETVKWVTERICYVESVVLGSLVREHGTRLIKGIRESYGQLVYAYSLTMPELMEKLADVRLGVIMGELPIKDTAIINEIIERCALSPEIIEGITAEEKNKARANIVRKLLTEEK